MYDIAKNNKLISDYLWLQLRPETAFVILTSAGISQLSAAQEAQVSRPGPDSLRVTKAEFGVEVVSVQSLLAVNCVVACGIVRTAHPDLTHTQSGL